MRLNYRCTDPKAKIVTYRQGAVRFCCAEMCRWWNRLIGFGVRDAAASTDRAVNLFMEHPQANGSRLLEIVPVEYCPWCGEFVEMVRTK